VTVNGAWRATALENESWDADRTIAAASTKNLLLRGAEGRYGVDRLDSTPQPVRRGRDAVQVEAASIAENEIRRAHRAAAASSSRGRAVTQLRNVYVNDRDIRQLSAQATPVHPVTRCHHPEHRRRHCRAGRAQAPRPHCRHCRTRKCCGIAALDPSHVGVEDSASSRPRACCGRRGGFLLSRAL